MAGATSLLASQANGAILITVDKASQQMSVVIDGEHRWTWPVSTGRLKYDTPNGAFTTFRMVRDHRSREWDDAPMPHSIFFTRAGHAIHGSYAVKRLGRAASHGCVRLAPKNAAKLFALVRKHGLGNTQVVIAGELPSALPRIAVPMPRTRRTALRQIAKLDTLVATNAKPVASAIAAAVPDAIPLPRARGVAQAVLAETENSAVTAAEAPPTVEPQPRSVAVAADRPADLPAEQRRISIRAVASPQQKLIAIAPAHEGADLQPEHPALANRDAPADTRAETGHIVVASHPSQVIAKRRSRPAPLPRQWRMDSKLENPAIAANEAPSATSSEAGIVPVAMQPVEPNVEQRATLIPPVLRNRGIDASAARHTIPVVTEGDPPAAAQPDPEAIATAARSPDVDAEAQPTPHRAIPLPRERRLAVRMMVPPQQEGAREQPPQQETHKLPRPRALPEPPRRRAARVYDAPVYRRHRVRRAPRVYYAPRAEFVEEFYVNGHWVRRRYYRWSEPDDFYGFGFRYR